MSIDQKTKLVSIIIPTLNESEVIIGCIKSLVNQTYKLIEIIIVDDGSIDGTLRIVKSFLKVRKFKTIHVFSKNHQGPGTARNLGADKANGRILVFVDADMFFEPKFIERLVEPILKGNTIGTDSHEEYLANSQNYWAKCWNLGRYSAAGIINQNYMNLMIPNKKNKGGIFRAILKSEFVKVGGFDIDGEYTDDETLSRKLNKKATLAHGAVFYHLNPSTLREVWDRATWIGSGKRYTNNLRTLCINFCKFIMPISFIKGLIIGFNYKYLPFVLFKVVYDLAVWLVIVKKIIL